MKSPAQPTRLPEETEENLAQRSTQSAALSLGTQLMAGMVVFAGLGIWLDHRYGTGPAATLAGLFLGLFYGGYEVWKLVVRINAGARKEQDSEGPPRS